MIRRPEILVLVFVLLQSSAASAFDWSFSGWTWSVAPGFGGAGITKSVSNNKISAEISRAESPGIIGVEISKMTSDHWRFSVAHRRGFRLGPFSSGVGFTAVSWNWYYMGPPPRPVNMQAANYVTEDGWAPYLGVSTGIAQGTISREGDEVSSVSSSGVIAGIRAGVDYRYSSEMILRPEVIASQTFFNNSFVESSMSEFGVMCGFVFLINE